MAIKRVVLLTSAAVLALALTAGTASATVLDANDQPYFDTISASTSSSTITNELISITCAGTLEATFDSDSGDVAEITDMTLQNCSPSATIEFYGLPYTFVATETTFTITSAGGMTINAVGVFDCTASWTAGDIVVSVNWSANTITVDATLTMSGTGCGDTANWTAVYVFTPALHWG